MKKYLPLFFCCMFFCFSGKAQFSRYIIRFKDKANNSFSIANPAQFLSPRAIQKRTRYNISIDSTDLPVTSRYLDSLRAAGAVTILNTSKWLNQAAIKTTDAAALQRISDMPFVISATPIGSFAGNVPVIKELDPPADFQPPSGPVPQSLLTDYYAYGRSNGQVKIHKGEFLHNLGFRGNGMQLAMMDAGFYHYLSLPTFDSIRLNNQILGTWDFVANEASVDEDNNHGMQCLSTIAANLPGSFIGTAPKTSFYLYRTEDVSSEYPVEEQNYAAALERADSAGADVSSTSLGYYNFDNASLNYTYASMNGNTTISARAADMAAKKGMLLVVAVGNEGGSAWHYLITPSDADSVLAVGAVDTLGNVAGFSSYGPSSDGQVKPGVAAVGLAAVVANINTGTPIYNNGTSFACPNMAGLATCLWQAFPEINNMGIIDALQRSASKFSTPDTRVGYGIPDMKKSFVLLLKRLYTQQAVINQCKVNINLKLKTGNNMSLIVERKTAGEPGFSVLQTLPGTGAFSLQDISLTDDLSNSNTGAVNYRFKMAVDTDTSFYLDSVVLNYAQPCDPTANAILVGPNPASSTLNISIARTTAAKVAIVLNNAAGQKIYSKDFQQAVGVRVESIPMKNLNHGVYFLTIYIDNKKAHAQKILH
ncbi:MAG: family serine peptidase [Ferruginibacter sp.]|nr:family serine peptidase [Ferruginibacter sp.]